jgi:monovalent cation:H+ antiporter-2, CPA2 family
MITTLLALAAAAATGLAQRLRVPAVPVLILAGAVLAAMPGVPTLDVGDPVPQLALAFLVFAAGLELESGRVGRQRSAALRVGVAQFVVVGACGILAAVALGLAPAPAAYVGLGLGASSTIVVVRLLVERRQLFEPFGRLVLGVLLVQDLLMIVALAALAGSDEGVRGAGVSVLWTLLLGFVAYAVVRPLAPRAIARIDLDQETLVLAAIAMLLAFAGAAYLLDLPAVVGAFLAGASLSIFPIGGMVRAPIASVGTFFAAVFFVALGSSLEIPPAEDLAVAGVSLLVVFAVTPIAVLATAGRTGLSQRGLVEAGLLLAQCGELTLVLAVIGRSLGHLDEGLFSALSLVTVASMVLTPIVATDRNAWWLSARLPRPAEKALPPLEDHVILLGCGTNSAVLLDMLLLTGRPVVVVDRDAAVIGRLRGRDVAAVCGEGSDPAILDAVHARDAKVVISTMRRPVDNARVLRHLRGPDAPTMIARVFDDADAERLAALGAKVVSEAEVGAAEAVLVAASIGHPPAAAESLHSPERSVPPKGLVP